MYDIFLLLLSFFLVTILGGAFGAYLQQRTWQHQRSIEQKTRRREAALEVFEVVSTLMDRRLYRLEQLRIWSERDDEDRFVYSLGQYRSILEEWNGNINRILAKQQIYLGESIRKKFDHEIGDTFVTAGAKMEALIRERKEGDQPIDTTSVKRLVLSLRTQVYNYNLSMLRRIEDID